MADKSIAAALKAYFLRCPLLGDHPLGVNWLPDHGAAACGSIYLCCVVCRITGRTICGTLQTAPYMRTWPRGWKRRPKRGIFPTWGLGATFS